MLYVVCLFENVTKTSAVKNQEAADRRPAEVSLTTFSVNQI